MCYNVMSLPYFSALTKQEGPMCGSHVFETVNLTLPFEALTNKKGTMCGPRMTIENTLKVHVFSSKTCK